MEVYPLVLPHKVKIFIEGLRKLCLRWWKSKVIHGIFEWIGGRCGVFYSTRRGETLVGCWTTGSRI